MTVKAALEASWDIETTYCVDNWERQDPAWGQCAVSAVVTVTLFGGEYRKGWTTLPDGFRCRHYWAVVDGEHVDFTWRQFPVGTVLREVEPASFEDLVANRWMRNRSMLLMKRVTEKLNITQQTREEPVNNLTWTHC